MLVSNTIFNVISFKTYQNKIIMYYHIKLVYAISPLCVLSFFLYVLHFHRTSNFCSLSSWFKKKNNNIIIMFALPAPHFHNSRANQLVRIEILCVVFAFINVGCCMSCQPAIFIFLFLLHIHIPIMHSMWHCLSLYHRGKKNENDLVCELRRKDLIQRCVYWKFSSII